jgi:putative transposase
MTEERMALLELIGKRGDTDPVRALLAYAADRLMAVEVDGLYGAGDRERSPARTNQRDGYRERAWDTRAGRIELKIPKLRPAPSTTSCGPWARRGSRGARSRGSAGRSTGG